MVTVIGDYNMRLEVLVSTMFQENYDLISKMQIDSDAVIVNQSKENAISSFCYNNNSIIWINSDERGLSKSRNCALHHSNVDICLLADDDLKYHSNYKEVILRQFELHPDTDIIAFRVKGIEHKFKNYHDKIKNINLINSMKISSVEIAFRTNKIKDNSIKFNELFGAGAKYYMGEESIFLSECLRKGLKIKYIPIYIADLHLGESSWFTGYNEEYLINKGAVFTAMSPKLSSILIIQFAVRKIKLYSENFNMFNAIKFMFQGRKKYLYSKKSI